MQLFIQAIDQIVKCTYYPLPAGMASLSVILVIQKRFVLPKGVEVMKLYSVIPDVVQLEAHQTSSAKGY